MCHSFHFLFRLPRTLLFMSNSAGVPSKAEDDCPISTPGQCSKFLVESELLIYFYYFVCIILVYSCHLLCLSVFQVSALSLDYIVLISAKTLVPLITLLPYKRKKYSEKCLTKTNLRQIM